MESDSGLDSDDLEYDDLTAVARRGFIGFQCERHRGHRGVEKRLPMISIRSIRFRRVNIIGKYAFCPSFEKRPLAVVFD